MKRILTAALAALTISATSFAESRINLGAMSLDSTYVLTSYKNYIGTFTAPATGVVTAEATSNDVLYPYREELDDMYTEGNAYDVTMNNYYGNRSYDFNVEEGKTYVMYANFVMTNNTQFKMTLTTEQSIHLTTTYPEEGSTFQVSNGGQISFDFDKAVAYSGSTISVGQTSQKISGNLSTNGIFFDVKTLVFDWLSNGTAKPGDTLSITLNGVCMSSNHNVLCNGDGIVTGHWVLGSMPITLVSTRNTSGTFLSYYAEGNDAGIVSLTFSGPVNADRAHAVLKYGNLDKDIDGDYYEEQIPCTVEGCIVSVNLQGKRRRAIDMVASGTDYETIVLGVTGILDKEGNYAYSASSGSLGSYWYSYDFKEVSANVVCEFTPASGSRLDGVKNIELWITDEDKLSYEGVLFSYEKEGEQRSILVTDYTKEADPDDATAKILNIAVPADLEGAENIAVSLQNLQCADGTDYSSVIRAKYNAFIVSRTTPVANSTMEWLNEGQTLKIFTNMDSDVDYLRVKLIDLKDSTQLFLQYAQKADKGFAITLDRKVRMEIGHDYKLNVEAVTNGKTIGEDYIIWHGAAEAFRYSDVLLTNITPDPDIIPDNMLDWTADSVEITLTFDGLVKLPADENFQYDGAYNPNALQSLHPVDDNGDGYATIWRLVPQKIYGFLEFHIVAYDLDDHRVKGNQDVKDYSWTSIDYEYVETGIREIQEDTTPIIYYNIMGQRVGKDYRGIVIKRQ